MSKVTIENVGAIGHIEFDLPEGTGGVKILTGTSGIERRRQFEPYFGLLGDKSAIEGLTPTDGEEKGEVSGLGRSLKISKRSTQAGSASVPHLCGKLDVEFLLIRKWPKQSRVRRQN